MKIHDRINIVSALLVALLAAFAPVDTAAQEVFTEAFPSASSNGAMHYNSAMLSLSTIEPARRALLAEPIWAKVRSLSKEQLRSQLSEIVFEGRHVIIAAMLGSEQNEADFGIDYSAHGLGTMPHVAPMLRVGRLMTLAGLHAQSTGDWKTAGSGTPGIEPKT